MRLAQAYGAHGRDVVDPDDVGPAIEDALGKNLPIIPGMVAEVDVLTGKKSVLAYLLKPILRAKANALTER